MTKIKLRRLTTDISEHITRYYVRLPGQKKIRINGEPGSEQFMTEYRAALAGERWPADTRPQPTVFAPKTLGRAIQDYYTSGAFKKLSDSRKRSRRLILNKIAETSGHELVKAITKAAVQKGMDRRADTPSAANEFLKAMREVLSYLASIDEVKENVAKLVPYNVIDTEGFHTWTLEEVSQFVDHHKVGSKAVLAMSLMLFTGQRRGDVIKMGPQHVENGSMRVKRSKNNLKGEIPVLPPLQTVIDATPIGHMNYLVTEFGKPFSPAGIGNWFRKRCNEAGLPQCTAHGLRKAGATIAAEAGASDEQLMALFGWKSGRMVSTYTREANQKKLATEAAQRIATALTMNKIVPPAKPILPGRDRTAKNAKGNKR